MCSSDGDGRGDYAKLASEKKSKKVGYGFAFGGQLTYFPYCAIRRRRRLCRRRRRRRTTDWRCLCLRVLLFRLNSNTLCRRRHYEIKCECGDRCNLHQHTHEHETRMHYLCVCFRCPLENISNKFFPHSPQCCLRTFKLEVLKHLYCTFPTLTV